MLAQTTRLSGWLLLLSLGISMVHGFYPRFAVTVCGLLYACATVLLLHRLINIQKIQVSLLTVIGLLLMGAGDGDLWSLLAAAITANNTLITLIISVGFLKLIIKPNARGEALPTGNTALWKTLLGAHLFGAVINLSAIVIFADRLLSKGKLSDSQIMMLTRTFGANALWSPFFAAMGASLLYSDGAELSVLMSLGLCAAACSLVLTGLGIVNQLKPDIEIFEGYPMHLESLILPAILSVLVLLMNYIFADVSILILVAGAVMVTVVITLLVENKLREALSAFKRHVENGTVNSASELSLFLSAGLLAVGITSFSISANYQLPFAEFTGHHAAFTLVCMVLVSLIGVHPVISISVMGGVLAPISPDPNLLGLMFLFCWGISIVISPFSGISLLFQSRYQIKATRLMRLNSGFTFIMLSIACTLLVLYG